VITLDCEHGRGIASLPVSAARRAPSSTLLRALAGAALALVMVLAGCSTSAPVPDQREAAPAGAEPPPAGEPTASTPTPNPTSTPVPTPTPLPDAEAVVADSTFTSGELELVIEPAGAAETRFVGRFGSDPAAVELTFLLADFLAFAAVADPTLVADPLAEQAAEVLAGEWVVRSIDGVVYVQQELLAQSNGAPPGGWVQVEDPLIVDLLGSAGVLAGGLDHRVVVDLVRSAGRAVTPPVAGAGRTVGGESLTAHDLTIDGPALSVLGLGPEASAALVGIGRLHVLQTPARIWLDGGGILRSLELSVPADGFVEGSVPTRIEIRHREAATVIDVPEISE
jgi:hypothetical protein